MGLRLSIFILRQSLEDLQSYIRRLNVSNGHLLAERDEALAGCATLRQELDRERLTAETYRVQRDIALGGPPPEPLERDADRAAHEVCL